MAKNHGSPLGFATVGNTTAGSFFAFITGATTVSGIFLCLFGLTSFSYILVGDPNVSMYTVLQGLSMLPNPLEFVKDCNQILVAFSDMLARFEGSTSGISNSGLKVILDFLINIATVIFRIWSYVIAFGISIVFLPFYLIYFFARCGACLFLALGFKWTGLYSLSQPWQPITFIIGLMRGV